VMFSLLQVAQLVIDISGELAARHGIRFETYGQAVRALDRVPGFAPDLVSALARLPGLESTRHERRPDSCDPGEGEALCSEALPSGRPLYRRLRSAPAPARRCRVSAPLRTEARPGGRTGQEGMAGEYRRR
jgi:hypothetical protein